MCACKWSTECRKHNGHMTCDQKHSNLLCHTYWDDHHRNRNFYTLWAAALPARSTSSSSVACCSTSSHSVSTEASSCTWIFSSSFGFQTLPAINIRMIVTKLDGYRNQTGPSSCLTTGRKRQHFRQILNAHQIVPKRANIVGNIFKAPTFTCI